MVIDHPSIGEAAHLDLLLPLDQHLPADFLADQAPNSVGQSHAATTSTAISTRSPSMPRRPSPATGPTCSHAPDAEPPRTWDDLLALARRGLVTVPAIPIDSLMNLFMLANALGDEPFSESR